MYTHILLGPEQATSPEFRKILQDPNFQGELRRSLLSETVFFGCSATLDLEKEDKVKSFGGF
jgi:hypothetical protein